MSPSLVRPRTVYAAALTAAVACLLLTERPALAGRGGALVAIRGVRAQRERLEEGQRQSRLGRAAAVVRLRNETADLDIPDRLAAAVEAHLRAKGFSVKDWGAVQRVVASEDRGGLKSRGALERLSRQLESHLLVFLTVETCTVSTFRQEYEQLLRTGNLDCPDDEFVELQVKASVFDAGSGSVVFSRADRQFETWAPGAPGPARQAAFDRAVSTCVANLFFGFK